MPEKDIFEVRDLRNKQFFQVNDVYLNGYARKCGIYATGVYLSLCRHASKEQKCFPSKRLIAQELGISERSVYNSLSILEKWSIVKKEPQERKSDGSFRNTVYILLDKSVWKKEPSARGADGEPSARDDITRLHVVPNKDTHIKETHTLTTNVVKGEPLQREFGNEEINQIISCFKEKFGLKVLDDTYRWNRIAAKNLIRKFSLPVTLKLIEVAAADDWWRGRMTKLDTLYKNAIQIMSKATNRQGGGKVAVYKPGG